MVVRCLSNQKRPGFTINTTDKQSGTCKHARFLICYIICRIPWSGLIQLYTAGFAHFFENHNFKINAEMKNNEIRRQPIAGNESAADYALNTFDLCIGDVYLFNRTNKRCPPESSLWGMFDKREGAEIYLESSSDSELCRFTLWHKLPDDYRYCRLATREELQSYIYRLTWFECRAGK